MKKIDRFTKGISLFVIGVLLMCLSSFFSLIMNFGIIIMLLTFLFGSIIFMIGLWWMIDDEDDENYIVEDRKSHLYIEPDWINKNPGDLV